VRSIKGEEFHFFNFRSYCLLPAKTKKMRAKPHILKMLAIPEDTVLKIVILDHIK